jgi:ribonuclease-3
LEFYIHALRHKSAARNIHNKPGSSNERLEFLGDAILDAAVAHYLFSRFPGSEEGELTKMKSRIVSRNNLNKVAIRAGLHLLLETDSQAHYARESLGGNALEAILGAVYLDRGYEVARSAVLRLLQQYSDMEKVQTEEADFKSRLFETAHRMRKALRFDTRQMRDDTGRKFFSSKVFLNEDYLGSGRGFSKKKAEQEAAAKALRKLNEAEA